MAALKPQRPFHLGPAEIDLDARRVRIADHEHPLSELEARLLAFLLERKGATVTRRELLEPPPASSPCMGRPAWQDEARPGAASPLVPR